MKKCNGILLMLLLSVHMLSGCHTPFSMAHNEMEDKQEGNFSRKKTDLEKTGEAESNGEKKQGETGASEKEAGVQQVELLHFVDAFGKAYQVKLNTNVKKHDYQLTAFTRDGDRLSYQGDGRYSYRLGVDVSYHNGYINWEKVKSSGYEFAFLRIGYRGYGQAGNVYLDEQFFNNMKNAQAAGMDVGVYFFSQAVNVKEAKQEAEFVLKNLQGYELQLPVVYDPENILDDEARTDDVTGAQFTKNTTAFCKKIEKAGYQPMIYSNMLWEAFQFDLEKLSEYPIWYADYEPLPQTPYNFVYWQYSNEGTVDGIEGAVDLDIQLIRK